MSSARQNSKSDPPPDSPHTAAETQGSASRGGDLAAELARLRAEMRQAANRGLPENQEPESLDARGSEHGLGPERSELESLRRAAIRWSGELERLQEAYESSGRGERRGYYGLEEKEAELKALRAAAADRELGLQKEHAEESRRQREEISALKQRLGELESGSDSSRKEELREAKRLAYERERELRRVHAEKLSEAEEEAGRRISALQAQRAADNRSLVELHADEKARREEELESLRLRRLSEARVYGSRLEELARERAGERTSLEEAVAKLREKHETERARLQDRVDELEEALEEQEFITVGLLGELGYVHGTHHYRDQVEPRADPKRELEVAAQSVGETSVQEALREIRGVAAPANLLREGLALFNYTGHPEVVEAISKSLGEPEVYVTLETVTGGSETPVITVVWPGMGWRRYVSEPLSTSEPKVYLTGYGDETDRDALPGSGPNARLDGRGLLSLGVRPL